jgi:pilus assembly protein CpaE
MKLTPEIRPGAPIFLVAVLRSAALETQLKSIAGAIPGIRLETEVGGFDQAKIRIGKLRSGSIVLVDLDLADGRELEALEAIMKERGERLALIATSNAAPLQGVRQLMRMGIPDFLPQPLSREDLVAALFAAKRKVQSFQESARKGQVIAFIRPCGGLGATTLAVQAACALARRERNKVRPRVALIDLDLQFGSAALYLDIESQLNLFNIIDAPDRLDGAFLQGLMAHHASGLDVLAGPSFVVPLDAMTPELVTRLLDIAANDYDYVVLDLPQAWTLWSHAALSHSNLIVCVTQFTVAALRQGRRLLDAIRQEGLEQVPKKVVVNRFERSIFSREIRVKEAEKALGRGIDFFIDNDYRTVTQALNQGVPVSEVSGGNKLQKQIEAMLDGCLQALQAADAEPAAV